MKTNYLKIVIKGFFWIFLGVNGKIVTTAEAQQVILEDGVEYTSVRYCDLVQNYKEYDGKHVVVRASYRYGEEWTELFGMNCRDRWENTWLEFVPEDEKKLRRVKRKAPRYQGTFNATFYGWFNSTGGRYGHLNGYAFEFRAEFLKDLKVVSKDGWDPTTLTEKEQQKLYRGDEELDLKKAVVVQNPTQNLTPKVSWEANYEGTQASQPNTESESVKPETVIEMVFVQGGMFTMGCTPEQVKDCDKGEKPAHKVILSDFYIGKYEVTQAQWKAVMGNNPSRLQGDDLPVTRVSWNEAQEFIRKLNEITGKNYRLPTEAEWEYAARGGNQSQGYKYSGSNLVGEVAWYDGNTGKSPLPVGTRKANELGIHDMSGNAKEWVNDWYGNYSRTAQTDPQGPATGLYRVYRGGSMMSRDASDMRVSVRNDNKPDRPGTGSIGFRLAHNPN